MEYGPNTVVRVKTKKPAPVYDMQKIDKNLKLDRNLIISGSVLTGVGLGLFVVGGIMAIPGKPTTSTGSNGVTEIHHSINFLPWAFWAASFPEIVAGVPLLAVGLSERHKWRQRKQQLEMHAGLLGDGVGVVAAF